MSRANVQARDPLAARRSSVRRFFAQPVYDIFDALEALASTRRPGALMIGMLVIGAAAWFIYVPIHELLHVAGCELAGGDVSQLELLPRYGGSILAHVFPWVVTESKYAGRLSGFDTKGSDWIYLATDFGPFVLTILLGVPLIKLCARKGRPILFPIAIVLGLAPFYNLTGDYYEMGSIVTTRVATLVAGPRYAAPPAAPVDPPAAADPGAAREAADASTGNRLAPAAAETVIVGGDTDSAFAGLRSDDIFSLFANFFGRPSLLGIGGPFQFTIGLLIILIGMTVAVVLAFGTYFAGHVLARSILPRRR